MRIVKPIPVASLESLSFGSMFKAYCPWEDVFMSTSDLVDLSRLKSLDISISRAPSVLRNVRSIVPNLERLFINIHLQERHYDDLDEDDPEMVESIQEFNPLRFLAVRGLRPYSALQKVRSSTLLNEPHSSIHLSSKLDSFIPWRQTPKSDRSVSRESQSSEHPQPRKN